MTGTTAPPAGLPPHPRIRQRRVEVRRHEGRRRLRILLGSLATVALAGAGYGATRSPLLDVDEVQVRGASHTTADEVLAASGLASHPAMLDVRPGRVARSVEQLPWVAQAQVERRFPGTVEVTLLERMPVAAVPAAGGRWALVDISGRVLAHQDAAPDELARVLTDRPSGEPGGQVAQEIRAAIEVLDALPEALAGRVPQINVGERGWLELRLDGKVPVEFGPATQLRRKLIALATLVEKASLARVRHIDIRVPTAPVLTRG